jgi:anaerobic magnesium-protoporphyrin IX monomethyl ester cyclase
MDKPSRVALVFPYFRTRSQTEMLFPPLGIASLSSQLHRLGIETRIFDGTFTTLDQIQEALISYQPHVVGIYSMVSLSRNTFRIAEIVKASLPNSLLVAGGPMPTLYPEYYSQHFDAVFRGEADLSFPRFCRDFFDNGGSLNRLDELALGNYDGLFIQRNGLQIDNPTVHYTEEQMRTFPLPERGDFDHSAYQKAWLEKGESKTASLMTTLGCPFDCDFCSRPIYGNRFRRRDLGAVFEEIEQIRRLGYDTLWIADDNFTLDSSFLQSFCQRMAGWDMGWSCLSRSTGITIEIARHMKQAGCRRVYLGLETGSPMTLKLMNKKATLEDGINAVHHFHQAGVQASAFFIVGYPGETIESIEETFSLALSLPLADISFNVPYPLPGSKLFERLSGIDESKDWNTENEITFLYNSEFDPAWLRSRIEQTMQAFAEKKKSSA